METKIDWMDAVDGGLVGFQKNWKKFACGTRLVTLGVI